MSEPQELGRHQFEKNPPRLPHFLNPQFRDSQWLALERHRGATATRTSENEGLAAESANGHLEKLRKAGLSHILRVDL